MKVFRKSIYVLVIFVLFLSGCRPGKSKKLYFKSNYFVVEVVENKQQQERGLMFRRKLPSDSGMLFIFNSELRQSFYMKNMYIPLDIIWLDKNKKTVFIKEDAQPEIRGYYEVIDSEKPAQYVLEVNSGTVARIGLKIGDILEF